MKRIFHYLPLLLCLVGFLFSSLNFADDNMQVIALKYRSAEEIIPVVQPLLSDHQQVTGKEDTLIVKASPADFAAIQKVIEQLDIPKKQLLITVKQANSAEDDTQNTWQTEKRDSALNQQSIQVQEGEEAYITLGQSIQILKQYQNNNGNVSVGMGYQNLPTGFTVKVNLQGGKAVVNLFQQRTELTREGNNNFDQEQLQTSLTVPLEQWTAIAQVGDQTQHSSQTVKVYGTDSNASGSQSVYLKVSVVP